MCSAGPAWSGLSAADKSNTHVGWDFTPSYKQDAHFHILCVEIRFFKSQITKAGVKTQVSGCRSNINHWCRLIKKFCLALN